jgi:hypothetical protein
MLQSFMDCDPGAPTRWNSHKQILKRLDRIYLSTPTWLAINLDITAVVLTDPAALARKGGSDHAPVAVAISKTREHANSRQRIPDFVAETQEFRNELTKLTEYEQLEQLTPVCRWATHEKIIRLAAAAARDKIFAAAEVGGSALLAIMNSIARAVARQDLRFAKKIRKHPMGAKIFEVTEGQARLADPKGFVEQLNLLRKEDFEQQAKEIMAEVEAVNGTQNIAKQRSSRLLEMAKLWSPFHRRLAAGNMGCHKGEPEFSAHEKELLGVQFWEKTFAAGVAKEKIGAVFIKQYLTAMDYSSLRHPDVNDYTAF